VRLTRIFVDAPLHTDAAVRLPQGAAQHVVKVLRLQAGASLTVFNGHGGEFEARLEAVQRDAVTLRIGAHQALERESPLQVTLLQGIARGEKMDLILQKATELGINAVTPLLTARSSVRLDEAGALRKQAHWQAVVAGACEQSGRNRIPAVGLPMGFAQGIAVGHAPLKLLLAPDAAAGTLKTLLAVAAGNGAAASSICLLAGPEGGFDALEVQAATTAGFQPCRLGPRILRTETAALAALAALQTLVGDLT